MERGASRSGKIRARTYASRKATARHHYWVITRYNIDRNRVYLSGVSMGGCGALALGLPRGNVFAAILVDVPAGTEFAALRFDCGPDASPSDAAQAMWIKRMSGFGLPDLYSGRFLRPK